MASSNKAPSPVAPAAAPASAQAQAKHPKTATASSKKVGVIGLAAIVISAMVGGGIYNLPQSMAASASAGSQIVAWGITGFGMWFIANTFRILARVKPDMKNGFYTYAERGFGRFAGFLIAYGYWVCNCIALVAYGVMIMAAIGYFLPGLFGDGSNIASLAGASAITWLMFALACRGVKSGSAINVVGTIGKIVPVLIFIIAVMTVFQLSVFMEGFWGYAKSGAALSFNLDDVMGQVSGTMMITLFLFTGIEGAVVVSGDARNQADVSKATTIGFVVVLLLYSAVSILPLGIYTSADIAGMADPSMAAIMQDRFGDVGAIIVNLGVMVAVLSSWLVWMLMLAQMPLYAARDGIFPKRFAKQNRTGAPSYSLLWSTIVIQVGLVASHFMAGNAWDTVVDISAVMCMPCYMTCAMFLWKVARKGEWPEGARFSKANGLATGIIGTVFALYLIYASGLTYLMIAAFVYAIGIPLFVIGRKQAGQKGPVLGYFTKGEKLLCAAVAALGVVGVLYSISSGVFMA